MHPVVAVELFKFGFPIPQFDRVVWVAGYLLLGHGFVVGDQGAEVHLPLQDLVPPAGFAPIVSDPLKLGQGLLFILDLPDVPLEPVVGKPILAFGLETTGRCPDLLHHLSDAIFGHGYGYG